LVRILSENRSKRSGILADFAVSAESLLKTA